MKLKLKYPVNVRPDPKTGEYDETVGKRLIAAGLATLETASITIPSHRNKRGRPKKESVNDLV